MSDVRTFDFRSGKNGWGHAIHGSTFGPAPSRFESQGWFKPKREVPRASVMVHCSPDPREGDIVLFSGQSGLERRCVVVGVESCWNPRDMFTITLEEAMIDQAIKEGESHEI